MNLNSLKDLMFQFAEITHQTVNFQLDDLAIKII